MNKVLYFYLFWTIEFLFGTLSPTKIIKTNQNNNISSSSIFIKTKIDDINSINTNKTQIDFLTKTNDDGATLINDDDDDGTSVRNKSIVKKLSRKKRYLAFPEGSSFSIDEKDTFSVTNQVAFCATVGFVGNPQYIYFSWAINWGLAYDLPNQTWIINEMHKPKKRMPKPVIQRRNRRELYNKLEIAIDSIGYNGRSCVLRALCESPQYFYNLGSNMVEEILRTIFSFPSSNVLPFEHPDLNEYDMAYRKGQIHTHCPFLYPDCSISLIELALGTYSNQ